MKKVEWMLFFFFIFEIVLSYIAARLKFVGVEMQKL